MYYTYLLEDYIDKSWYIGYTSDLKRRFLEHINKQGGKTTYKKHSLKLIYYEAYVNKKDAEGRERFLKSGSGRKYLKKQLTHYLET